MTTSTLSVRNGSLPPYRPQIHKVSTHTEFLMPLRIDDVNEVLDAAGPNARQDGNSSPSMPSQSTACRPRARPPSPTTAQEIRRVGGEIEAVAGKTVVTLDEDAVGRFLKWDALLHEIAHHLDRGNPKTTRKSEGFAEWCTTSVGFSRN